MSSKRALPPAFSQELVAAITNNDVVTLQQLKRYQHFCDTNNNSLLHLAVMNQAERRTISFRKKLRFFRTSFPSRIDAFRYLLTIEKIPKNVINSHGNSALMDALMYLGDHPECATELIKLGCDFQQIFPFGNTALHWSIKNEWLEVAELLIENGVSVDCKNSKGETPIMWACQQGFADEIWMLLFFGADPSGCFDIAAKQRADIQKIFFYHLRGYHKSFTLSTIMKLMQSKSDTFLKVLRAANEVSYSFKDLSEFSCKLPAFKPDFFRLFLKKFDYVVKHMLENCVLSNLFTCTSMGSVRNYLRNLFSLFESKLGGCLVDRMNSSPNRLVLYVIKVFKGDLGALTGLICMMCSYGVTISAIEMDEIYFRFGHCDLFKILLHMDIRIDNSDKHLIPQAFYDVDLTLNSMIREFYKYNVKSIHEIFHYFAPTRLLIFYMRNLHCNCGAKTPTIPSLVELSRNKAREYIIKKFQIRNSRQFYTVLRKIPIADFYKKIITFERRVY